MGEKIFLRAADARRMSEESSFLKNMVYKNIKYCANENRDLLEWDIQYCNSLAIKTLIQDLTNDGYNVSVNENENMLIITW